jgi:prephenate dehydrogenase
MFCSAISAFSAFNELLSMAIRQITIVGNGLIGGSLGLALKKHKFRGRIVGCDREATLERALARGAIDEGASDPGDAVRGSQVVVLAAPVLAILDLIERLGPSLSAKTLLTDVGSTKMAVTDRAVKVFGKNASHRFLGGHPMAGKETSGVDNADADLFHNAAWFLTPLPDQNLNDGLLA